MKSLLYCLRIHLSELGVRKITIGCLLIDAIITKKEGEFMESYYQGGADEYSDDEVINWEMGEYLEHKRSWVWYAVVIGGSLILSSVIYWMTQDLIAPLSILAVITLFVVFSFKKPQKRKYSLTNLGIQIGSRLYDYRSFKGFSIVKEDGVAALYLLTTQRFIPPITIYLPSKQDQHIIKRISKYIAYMPSGLHWSERLTQHLRF